MRAVSPLRALILQSLLQLLFSTLLAAGTLGSRLAFELLTLGYSIFVSAAAMLADYSAQVLLPDDAELLSHLPISPRTLFSARVANVLFFVTLQGLSLNLAPAVLGGVAFGPRFALAYVPSAFLAEYAAVGTVLAAQTLLLRLLPRERLQDVLVYVQATLAIGLFFGYQFVPHLSRTMSGEPMEVPRFLFALPPGWFAGLVEVGLGRTSPLRLGLAALALGTVGIVLPAALSRVADLYVTEPAWAGSGGGARVRPGGTRRAPGPGLFARLASRGLHGPARAGFDLTWAALSRDRALKLTVYPGLVMPLAMLIGIRAQGVLQSSDPMQPGSKPLFAAAYLAATFLALLPRIVQVSRQADAAWVLDAAPLAAPQALWQGARRALATRLALPVALLLGLLMSLHAPALHVAGHLAVVAAAGLLLCGAGQLRMRAFPLSLPPRAGASQARVVFGIFGVYLLLGLVGTTHAYLAWHASGLQLTAFALVLAGAGLLLLRTADRRFAARMESR